MPIGKRSNEAKKGVYALKNPAKYIGPKTEGGVLFRSSWEERMFYYMDHNLNVIEWSSEELIIPYVFRLDGKVHKYYPDIVAKIQTRDGIQMFIVEVKPAKQTVEPTKPKNRSLDRKKKFDKEMFVYIKNSDKWTAARKYCEERGYRFEIFTEKEIFGR